MERQGFQIPLLIGGATTSPHPHGGEDRPAYERPTTYVKDASRAVGVVPAAAVARERAQGIRRAPIHACASSTARGRAKSPQHAGAGARQPHRASTGRPTAAGAAHARAAHLRATTIAELARYIDWTPFFKAWELRGRFPTSSTTMCSRRAGAAACTPMRARCCDR
jgi:5-methyltetrahydrofolate--homocysteine methyltransferase